MPQFSNLSKLKLFTLISTFAPSSKHSFSLSCHSRVSRNRLQIIRERERKWWGKKSESRAKSRKERDKESKRVVRVARGHGGRWERGWVGKREKVGVAARGRVESTGRFTRIEMYPCICIPIEEAPASPWRPYRSLHGRRDMYETIHS